MGFFDQKPVSLVSLVRLDLMLGKAGRRMLPEVYVKYKGMISALYDQSYGAMCLASVSQDLDWSERLTRRT